MAFTIEQTNNATILTLAGDVNIATNATLRTALAELPPHLDLHVHAADLAYIDSSGIACLIMAYKLLRKSNRMVRLVNPSSALMNVLATLKFDTLFDVQRI